MNDGLKGLPTGQQAPLIIEEADGSPSVRPRTLIVSNGTLTDNGDGTATLTTGGGGGGGGGTDETLTGTTTLAHDTGETSAQLVHEADAGAGAVNQFILEQDTAFDLFVYAQQVGGTTEPIAPSLWLMGPDPGDAVGQGTQSFYLGQFASGSPGDVTALGSGYGMVQRFWDGSKWLVDFAANGGGNTVTMEIDPAGNSITLSTQGGTGSVVVSGTLEPSGAIKLAEITAPASPPANTQYLYLDAADSHVKLKDESGTVVDLSAGSGSGFTGLTLAGDTGTQAIADGDTLTVSGGVGLSSTAGATDKVTVDLDLNSLTEDTTPDGAADFLATYDTSASGHKKVKPKNLPAFTGDSGSGGVRGLVPAPATGDATKYLKGNGTWATVSGGSGTTWNAVCDGRLTLSTGVPIPTSDVTAATTLYFTPYQGNQVGLYDGSSWAVSTFTERSLSLSGLTADTNYDVFLYDNSGTLTLEAAAWTDGTTRATALVLQDGVYVKSGATTRRYLGTIRITGTTGQCEDSLLKRYVWNAYHRVVRPLRATDTTDTWTYASATWRQARATAANKVEYVVGLSQDRVFAEVSAHTQMAATTSGGAGIGVDSTSATSAQVFSEASSNTSGQAASIARYRGWPGIGYHYLAWLEYARTGTVTFAGDLGVATVQSGLLAEVLG